MLTLFYRSSVSGRLGLNVRSLSRLSLARCHVNSLAIVQRYSSQTGTTNTTGDSAVRPPFPFLWPSLPDPPDVAPGALPPIITSNGGVADRIFEIAMSFLVKFSVLNRAVNVGWVSMLLTRSEFPDRFLQGSVLAFQEFLRRLNAGEQNTSELLTPEFSKLLYQYLGSQDKPSNLEDRATISFVHSDAVNIRDVWLFLGPSDRFTNSLGKFGGLIESRETNDPKSKIYFLQLPFTSIVCTNLEDSPLSLQADSGLQIAIDVEIRAKYKYTYDGNEMTQDRVSVLRFMSQAFEGKRCETRDQRDRRIASIRDNIQWKIADIDYGSMSNKSNSNDNQH